jgi:hypothetical protein
MNFYTIWVLLSTWLVCTGWFLSLIKQLNAGGYVISLLLFGLMMVPLSRRGTLTSPRKIKSTLAWSKMARRFRRPFALIWMIYFLLALLGGALYAPTNYDALCYRIPRILHWWGHSEWCWIGDINDRMDFSAVGFEWLMAPLLILLKSDRLLFLINIISFAMLPGLIFSSFVGLGISKRVSWYWMWILPCAYCFVLQAGSIGNDTFATVYFLSAILFASRAIKKSSWWNAALALLSAALLTGAKATNLPLLLPLLFIMLPLWKILIKRPFITFGVISIGFLISFIPIALFNIKHCGDWGGDPHNHHKVKISNPLVGMVGNSLQIVIGSFAPSIFPMAKSWDGKAALLLDMPPLRLIVHDFPRLSLDLGELPIEEGAGLGLGIAALIVASGLGALFLKRESGNSETNASTEALVFGLLCWGALFAYMAKMGSESSARLISAYYPGLLLPVLAMSSERILVDRRWWRIVAMVGALAILPAVLFSPARPILPIQSMIGFAEKNHLLSSITKRAASVYAVYGARSDALAIIRTQLPAQAKTIGFAGGGNESEYSLWKPLGERQVVDLNPHEGGAITSLIGIDCIVGSERGIQERFHLTASELADSANGTVSWEGMLSLMAGQEPERWQVIVPSDGHSFKH